jgi:hypothetical protein
MSPSPAAIATLALLAPFATAYAQALIEFASGPVEQVAPAPNLGNLGYEVPNRSTPRGSPWMTEPALRERFDVPPDAEIKAYGVELEGTDVVRGRIR